MPVPTVRPKLVAPSSQNPDPSLHSIADTSSRSWPKPPELETLLDNGVNPRVLSANYLAEGASITTQILHVKYGTYGNNAVPAALIVFESDFYFPAKGSRTKEGNISVRFSLPPPAEPRNYPTILSFSPQVLLLSAPMDVAQKEVTIEDISVSHEVERHRTHRTEIHGTVQPDSNGGEGVKPLNTVVWAMRENEVEKTGLPNIFRAAVVIQLPTDPTVVDPLYPDKAKGTIYFAEFRISAYQASEIGGHFAHLVALFEGEGATSRFDSSVGFADKGLPRTAGAPDEKASTRLEDIDTEKLIAVPVVEKIPDGY